MSTNEPRPLRVREHLVASLGLGAVLTALQVAMLGLRGVGEIVAEG